ncbi:MAG: dihydrodipicolinate synthase family protein [Nitrospinota bacterium]
MEYTPSEAKAYCRARMKGVWAALTTPFTPSGELDEAGLRSNVRTCIEELKIDGFFCGGLMGEYWSLTLAERRRVQQIVCEESRGSAQVIAHTAHHCIAEAIALSRHAQEMGADYVIMINPIYGARDDDEVFLYFQTLARELESGIALFNQPKSGLTLSPTLIERLCDIENICCIKNAVPSLAHQMEVRRRVGDRIVVSDPDEERWLVNLAYLGQQVHMSSPTPYLYQVPGHLPMREYTDLALAGELAGAWQRNFELDPVRAVRRRFFTTGPDGRTTAYLKEWTRLLGLASGPPRPPVVPLREPERQAFRDALAAAGLLDHVAARV